MVDRLGKSDTLRVVGVFVLCGIGFTGGNLLLARVMSPAEFGMFALLLAVVQASSPLGPLGVDMLINRYRVRPDAALFARVSLQSVLVSAAVTLGAVHVFGVPGPLGMVLFFAAWLGAMNRVASAWYQSRKRHGPALWLAQSQNLAILVAAVIVWQLAPHTPSMSKAIAPGLIVMIGYLIAAVVGWRAVLANRVGHARRLPFVEGLAVVGAGGAELILVQADRLVIPGLLSMETLATYAVLVATMGAPFRVLQLAAGYSTVPRIRAAQSIAHRWRILAGEARVLAVITALGCAAMWVATPWLVALLTADKYVLEPDLMVAAVVVGAARVAGAFSCAAVNAIGAQRHLMVLTLVSWGSVAVGVTAAIFGARYGLVGVVYGIGAGWIMRAFGALLLLPASVKYTAFLGSRESALARG